MRFVSRLLLIVVYDVESNLFVIDILTKVIRFFKMLCFLDLRLSVCISAATGKHHSLVMK